MAEGNGHDQDDGMLGLSREQVQALVAGLTKIDAPQLYASVVHVVKTGNDYCLIFQKPRPAVDPSGGLSPICLTEVQAVIAVSPATLKDLSEILRANIANYEREYGEIESVFSLARKRQAAALPPGSDRPN